MSVFSVVADGQAGLFRLQQAKKPWEKELQAKDAQGQLAQKAERAQALTQAATKWQSDHASAQAALEEARRVGGPKQAAATRLEQVERKIEQLKLAMRFAQGDPQKLASLAREAALLAREAGRAAKEYGAGMKAAAEMGLPGDSSAATGGGTMLSSETTITRSSTSLTLQQTEVTLTIGVSTGEGASAESAADLMAADAGAESDSAVAAAGQDGQLPDDIQTLVQDVLSGLGGGGLSGGNSASAATGGTGGRSAMIQQLMADNTMKMSRYREADTFGQRVEGVLATSKRIIGEAKAANMLDESEKRRRERREGFKADDKMVEAAQKEVNALRMAALGSGEALGAAGLLGDGEEDGTEVAAVSPAAASAAPLGAQAAAVLNLLA
ncbi:hypothetical protein J2848_004065 [Azospirillum lipoferum]|uniref:Uncharacterized protein n=1 Tax=Azospirillum lipoferum TaxID=193 RepID=A0A5A9G344_AZOLI|nr:MULTISPECIES: hypothetical protein [Azospirillum]KAA0589033.1 hypothetical protein FZ942_32740 [Azospirillum lipoferum]MCP1612374.1 hypothetical protein [Azospirillum lipoferum]MDW5531842.1 hypothetical protein [Azospirillum sp. NL1]